MDELLRPASREVLLAFWKVHILHHAEKEPVHGQWIARELRHHGYDISPGTLYPILRRMEANGWLKREGPFGHNPKARKPYRLTKNGREVLKHLRQNVKELYREVVLGR